MATSTLERDRILARLIAFDTTSRNSNLALIDFVADYLAGLGVEAEVFHDPEQPKANLFATIGPPDVPGIVLSGHSDVVPVDGQPWSREPFALGTGDDRLWGRGTADMKGFIACVLAAVPGYLEASLTAPVHIALSYDEEVGCTGVASLIEALGNRHPRPRACIVGEPTGMKVMTGHKGIRHYQTRITGKEAHSSAPDIGVSAIAAAARLIGHIGDLAREMEQRADGDRRFALPFTTANVGLIEGGNAINIIARHCEFGWEYRPLPDCDESEVINRFRRFADDQVLADMRRIDPNARIETEECSVVPAFRGSEDSEAATLACALSGDNGCGCVSFATEAGHFQSLGIPTVVCGPGQISEAHQPDEFVEISQLRACDNFLERLAGALGENG